MKRTLLGYILPVLLLAGCASDQLSKQQAYKVLQEKYPHIIDAVIYAGDPKYAVLLQNAGLDTEGYVTTKKTKKLGDSTGWVSFTEKASPFLLETAAEDRQHNIQKVKAGEEKIAEILSIVQDETGKAAIVQYTTMISATPFGKLAKLTDGAVKQRSAELTHYDNEWHLKVKGMP